MEVGIQKRVCHDNSSLKGMGRLNCGAYLRHLAFSGLRKPLENRPMKVSFRKIMLCTGRVLEGRKAEVSILGIKK